MNEKKVLGCQLNPDLEVMSSGIKPPDVSDGDLYDNILQLLESLKQLASVFELSNIIVLHG